VVGGFVFKDSTRQATRKRLTITRELLSEKNFVLAA
jgi:hypothetical protein